MPFCTRKSPRIPQYDYSSNNYYFITLCTHGKKCIFWERQEMNQLGVIVKQHIDNIGLHHNGVIVDKYVVMPNHIHMIVALQESNISVNYLVALFKTGVTKQIREQYPEMQIWQRSFHDHIIRNQADYERIWFYIDTNPQRWDKDCFYQDLRAD